MRGQESAMEERRVRVNRQWRPTLVGADQWNSIKMQMDFVPRRREQCETRRPLGRGAFQFLRSVFVLFCLVLVFFFGFFFVADRPETISISNGASWSKRIVTEWHFLLSFFVSFFFLEQREAAREPEEERKKESEKERKKERSRSEWSIHQGRHWQRHQTV